MAIFCSVEPTEKSIAVGASKSVISTPLELLITTHETPQSQITNRADGKTLQKHNHYYQPAGRETSIQTPAGGEGAYYPRFLAFSHKKFARSEPKPLLLQRAAASSLVSAKKNKTEDLDSHDLHGCQREATYVKLRRFRCRERAEQGRVAELWRSKEREEEQNESRRTKT